MHPTRPSRLIEMGVPNRAIASCACANPDKLLAAWLCRNLPDPYTTHASKRAFVSAWLSRLLAKEGFDLARVNRQKFLLRKLLEDRIRDLRRVAVGKAYQEFFFSEGHEDRIGVGHDFTYHFHPDAYSPDRDYDGRYGEYQFRHHYYPRIGDFDGEEEYLLACHLDGLASKGEIRYWVRNLVRKAGCSFFLHSATGRFYPDFLGLLPDEAILIVENKGGHLWKDAEEDRKIGELWAAMSDGRCRFVMVKEKQWGWIDDELK